MKTFVHAKNSVIKVSVIPLVAIMSAAAFAQDIDVNPT